MGKVKDRGKQNVKLDAKKSTSSNKLTRYKI